MNFFSASDSLEKTVHLIINQTMVFLLEELELKQVNTELTELMEEDTQNLHYL